MMGEQQVQQDALFYEFLFDRHVAEKHLLRAIDGFVELDGVQEHLAPFYIEARRPSIVRPKFIAPADPATRWMAAHRGPASFAYSSNYLIDVDNAIIVDVEATTAIRQAEILAAKRTIKRSMECFDLYPARLIGDSAYGSAEMLNWLVHDRGIEPHIPVFDKSKHTDGSFSREDFAYDHASDTYCCPAEKGLQHYRRRFTPPRTGVPNDNLIRYRASARDCGPCPLKPALLPQRTRSWPRSSPDRRRSSPLEGGTPITYASNSVEGA